MLTTRSHIKKKVKEVYQNVNYLGNPFSEGKIFRGFNNDEITYLLSMDKATSGTVDRSIVIFCHNLTSNYLYQNYFIWYYQVPV